MSPGKADSKKSPNRSARKSEPSGSIKKPADGPRDKSKNLAGKISRDLKAESYYRDLYEEAPIMYHTIDLEGTILDCNREVLNKLGYTREEYVGHSLLEFLAPEYHESVPPTLNKLLKQGKIEGLVRHYRCKDGSFLHVELSAGVIRDDRKNPIAIRGALVDISDRLERERLEKRAFLESRLQSVSFQVTATQEYTEREIETVLPGVAKAYRQVLAAEAVALFHFSPNTNTQVNCALDVDKKLVRKMKEQIPSFNETMTFPIAQNKRMMDVIASDETVLYDGFHAFGRSLNIKAHMTLFPESKVVMIPIKPFGKPWGLIALVVPPNSPALEVTDTIQQTLILTIQRIEEWNTRLRDMRAKVESEKLFRGVVEEATDMIFKTDLDGNFSYVNPAAVSATGYSELELLGINYQAIIVAEDFENIRGAFAQQLKNKNVESRFETRLVTKSGAVIWVSIHTTVLRQNGELTGWQSIARDITERKQAEELAAIHGRRIQALNEVTQSLVSTLDFQTVAKKCNAIARELIDSDGSTIFLLNKEGTHLEPAVAVGPYVKEVMAMSLKVGEGITGRVARTGRSKIVNRVDRTELGVQIPGTPTEPESLLCAPLKMGKRTIGVITLRRSGTREYSDTDLIFLENLANVSAAAIDNARLMESLQRSEEDYRSLVELAVDPVVAMDESSRVVLWNAAATRIYGYSADEMRSESIQKLYSSEIAFNRHKAELRNFIKTGKSDFVGSAREVRTWTKMGERVDVILSLSARKTDKGWIFMGIMKDITEMIKARKEIERLANFPRENPSPVVEINTGGKITYMNPACESVLKRMGLKKDDIGAILPSDYIKRALKSLKKKSQISPQEVKLDHSVLLWSGHSLKDLKLVHFYATDITALKETEKELMKARDRAETSDRLKNVFLSTISHEVRTPLNVILGYSDVLAADLKGKVSEELEEVFDTIQESGERLKRLIEDILDVSHIEADQAVLNLELHEGDVLIKQSAREVLIAAQGKNLEVLEELQAPDIFIKVDKLRFQQVIGNILQNAVKFTHEGYIKVETSHLGDKYQISISDTGIGIRKDFQPHVFALFRQADDGNTRSFEGVGLGMAISHRLVTSMGGQIDVESEEGKGSTFRVTLPVEKRAKPVKTKKPHPVKPREIKGAKSEKGPRKVLILEDNPANLQYVEFLMKKLGMEYVSADTGEKALELLKDSPVQYMLVDITLALGMSGVEFMQQVRKQKQFRNAVIVAVTAHTMKGQKEQFLKEGFNDHLPKPFTLEDLRTLLNRIFS